MKDMATLNLSAEDLDILQEIMNIAFGKATAELAELIDIYVQLTVPEVKIIDTSHLHEYILKEIKDYDDIAIVEQNFWGGYRGCAILVFPTGIGKELITILLSEGTEIFASDPVHELEKGTLMEIGNILIGACLGKIAELLGDTLTYSPPLVHVNKKMGELFPQTLIDSFDYTIAMKTNFDFQKRGIKGILLILISRDSTKWLKKSLNDFMERFL